jgi:hypothetical protein
VDELPKNVVSKILRRERAKAEEEGVKAKFVTVTWFWVFLG